MRFYSLISSLILSVFLLFISGSESVRTLKHLTVRRGGSLTVPCLYEKKYKSNRKYWCKGEHWISCRIVAYANSSNTGISVTDHPSQNMFTVDLKNLQDSDSGWYWCAVEIGGYWTPDDGDSVYLTVSSDPAVWVENSTVIGQEGGGVSVQGYYSSGYENEEKKWCRVKDWSCYPFQNSTVNISDDKNNRSFRVEMIGLQKSDAGWYWFSAGDVGVTVHLTITNTSEGEISVEGAQQNETMLAFFITAGLLLLLIVLGLVIWKLHQRGKLATSRGSDNCSDDVLYNNVVTRSEPEKQPKEVAPTDHESRVIYSAVK
ncbi:polymeric immunoglobulin receptor-like isoform X2 [Astyanax mexicanus]|nr:polymeric immunoglobulin receptor-like isoform X2 [Astyanax mexicanus]